MMVKGGGGRKPHPSKAGRGQFFLYRWINMGGEGRIFINLKT